MPKIKEKGTSSKTIKALDRSKIIGQRMKNSYKQIKEKSDQNKASETSVDEYSANHLESGMSSVGHRSFNAFDKSGRKNVSKTKENIDIIKGKIDDFKIKRVQRKADQFIKTRNEKVFNSPLSTSGKGIKTSDHLTLRPLPAPSDKAKIAAKASSKASLIAKNVKDKVKKTTKASVSAIKMIIAGTRALIAVLIGGGWIFLTVIIIICMIALLLSSVFGIFFSGEDSGTGMTMQSVVSSINENYENELSTIKENNPHDVLEMKGSRAVWKEVLAVYSVKVNTDPNNPQEVVTVTSKKQELLEEIFWEMNEIDYEAKTETKTIIEESDDGHGNIVESEKEETFTTLYITVSHKEVDDMIIEYDFNETQISYLNELLAEENNTLWSAVLYGISSTSEDIVKVALEQVGNIGGNPYWSWYGFSSRVEWCACFVSWCANECGYIENGVIPKFAGVSVGIDWFKDRAQWADNTYTPESGAIIFFDWESDGKPDHVGIVEKCENGIIYTIEGNSLNDSCLRRNYIVGSSIIYGYGLPAY